MDNPSFNPNNSAAFVFSGLFNKANIKNIRLVQRLNKVQTIICWLFTLLAGLSLVYICFQIYSAKNLAGISYGLRSLLFWLGVLSLTLLWAIKKETENNENKIKKFGIRQASLSGSTTDLYDLFNPAAKEAWISAYELSAQKNPEIRHSQTLPLDSFDLLLALLENPEVKTVFRRLRADPADIKTILKNHQRLEKNRDEKNLSGQIPFMALKSAIRLGNDSIDPLMLLLGLVSLLPEEHLMQSILLNLDVDTETLDTVCSWIFKIKILKKDFKLFKKLARFKPEGGINRGLTSVPTFYFDRFSRDLTAEAKHATLPIASGRLKDLRKIFALSSQTGKNILVLGPQGSGRKTVIYELAYRMASEQVTGVFSDKRLCELEISALLGSREKTEDLMVQSLSEATNAGNIILVIEDISRLAKAPAQSGLSLLEVLLDFLQNQNLTVLATDSLENYSDYLKALSGLESNFFTYELKPLTKHETLLACCMRASILEAHNNCWFYFEAIKTAAELSDLYIKDLAQPEKSIRLLSKAASLAAKGKSLITSETIENIISQETHIPSHSFRENEADKLLNLENTLAKKIIGQTQAVRAVSEGLRRSRSGLSSQNRPLASFLFLGPTGVGKTEIAKVLAQEYFGKEEFLLRLDMSEYQGADALEKLLGKNGQKTDSPTIRHLKNYPFCLLLLDEFEKASKKIHNLFLQILDDGRLTSGKGETLDLTHTLIIATSNAGSSEIQKGIHQGLQLEEIKEKLFETELRNYFAPELLNRFDSTVVFSPLTQNEVEKIAELQLYKLSEEALKKGIKLKFAKEVLSDIAQNAFDPEFGARPIRRYIQDRLESFIAKLLLSRAVKKGSSIEIGIENEKYIIK